MTTSPLFTQITDPKVSESTIESTTEAIKSTESPQDSKINETFQRIIKQESHLKLQRAKIDEARKSFEAEKDKADKYKSLEGKDPFSILEHFGITYDKLLEADRERKNPLDPAVKKALERVEQLETKILNKEDEVTKEKRARAEVQMRTDIAKTIKENDYDILEIMNAEQTIVDYMEEIYSQTGDIPEYKDACEAVMNNLVEQYHKLSSSRFVKPKEEPIKESIQKSDSKATTLTNKMTQTSVSKNKPQTEAERFAAALSALNSVHHK